jgi:cardiolipin synthase
LPVQELARKSFRRIPGRPGADGFPSSLPARAPSSRRTVVAWTRRRTWWVVGTAVATLVVTLVVVNLMPPERRIDRRIEHLYDVGSPAFYRSIGVLVGPPTVQGNRVADLQNGDEIFPAMLAAIRGAKRTITFETYIYWSGEVGRAFADALAERAKAGVRVHVLLDWVGSQKIDDALLAEMRGAGVEIELYRPLHWYHLAKFNNRTHRKLLVVDGRVGFTGGVGIADKWGGHAQDPDHWRDSHYRAEGPVVAQMQATFLDNWAKVTGAALHGDDYFPPIEPQGGMRAQTFSSSPEGGADSMQLMYLLAITSAARSIALASAYFVPDKLTTDAWSPRSSAACACASWCPARSSTPTWCDAHRGPAGSRCSRPAPRSTSTSRRCSTARS